MYLIFSLLVAVISINVADKAPQIMDFTLEHEPFRMRKTNLVWSSAKKTMTVHQLADLYADLLIHDKHEMALKKLRSDGMDEDGLKEASINMKFRDLLEKYGLKKYDYSKSSLSNNLLNGQDDRLTFADKKLQLMWTKAQKTGFSAKDLQTLKEEFEHQQMKIDDINLLKELEMQDITENDVDSQKRERMPKEFEYLDDSLRRKKKNAINDGYNDLQARYDQMDKHVADFSDHRVQQLWALALKTNWSKKELESFKEELQHFDTRLQKLEYLGKRLEHSMPHQEEGVQDERSHDLEDRFNHNSKLVNKLHTGLKMRVMKSFRHHTEL